MKERILFWDILKGIGIISIVLGHCCHVAAPYVYTYHLALFFFVSAYFYNEKKYVNAPFEYVGNLFKNNWTKYVFYSVVFVLIHNLCVTFNLYYGIEKYQSAGEMISAVAASFVFISSERFGGAMWFVLPNMVACTALAFGVCISARCGYFVKGKQRNIVKCIVLVAFMFLLMLAFHKNYMIFSAHNAFLMLPVCLEAYFVRKLKDPLKYINVYVAVIFAAAIAVLVNRWGFRVELSANMYPGLFWLYVLSFMGIYVCGALSVIINKIPKVNKFIGFLGENSFAIMALHFLVIKMVDRIYCFAIGEKNPEIIGKWVCSYPDKLWWVYLIAGTVLPALAGLVLKGVKTYISKAIEKRV